MKEFYYYFKDRETNHPNVTICFVVDGNQYARGIAICSEKDNVNKNRGRSLARGRALKALHTGKYTLPTLSERSMRVMHVCDCHFSHKSSYKPILTGYEERLLNKIR